MRGIVVGYCKKKDWESFTQVVEVWKVRIVRRKCEMGRPMSR